MTNTNDNDQVLPTPGNNKRTASDHIPKFFRSESNRKFIQGTMDQMISPGELEQLSGFAGRKTAKSFNVGDNYISDVSSQRENYQLEPATLLTDDNGNITFYKDYNDYVNTLKFLGANTSDESRLNSQETYAWDPHIDWDKFVNFREYYWMPNGPETIAIKGQQREVTSTYTVSTVTDDNNTAYVFSEGSVRNPTLTLYRGQKYRFEIDTPGHPIAFSVSRSFTPGSAIIVAGKEGIRGDGLFDSTMYGSAYDQGDFIVLPSSGTVSFDDDDNASTLYPEGIRKLGEAGEEISTVYVEKGVIEFTVPRNAPDQLYYISKNNIDTSGRFKVEDIEENTFLNVGEDIIGKKFYQTNEGVDISNGMKVKFLGNIEPEVYENSEWYVEGVGSDSGIRLVNEKDLVVPAAYSTNLPIDFDTTGFDKLPFANASHYAGIKDYVVINRASNDKNPWSRYNRWFHRSVIEASLRFNDIPTSINEDTRAKRPIIEFDSGLQLYNYGTQAKQDIDLVDTYTKDVFSIIEGSYGYNVDGVELLDGMRVMFTADTDRLVDGKIFEVNTVKVDNDEQIRLVATSDTDPLENEVVFVTQGETYAGKTLFYFNSVWKEAQDKLNVNQPPLFQLCCPQGNDYSNLDEFESSTFSGTKIFSYRVGTGSADDELGFPLAYRNIENSGDILFDFNLVNEAFSYQDGEDVVTVKTDTANLRKYKSRTDFEWVNGFSSNPRKSIQYVYSQHFATTIKNNQFEVDVYDNAALLTDLKLIVYVDNKLMFENTDYSLLRINNKLFVNFENNLKDGSVVLFKTSSSANKNNNGYYEFPHNLERNPLNEEITDFTLGEVIDHVDSMVEELRGFRGVYPGVSNLRDLGNTSQYGTRFVKHAGPLNNPLYHITTKDYNIVKALRFSKDEYNKFKRVFLETASELGFDGETHVHFDKVMQEVNKDKIKTQPYYFSDMVGCKNSKSTEFEVFDARITQYPLPEEFNLEKLSNKSVLVYLGNQLLVHGRDYKYGTEGTVDIHAGQQRGEVIRIVNFSSTNGCFVPPTPTKLGLYPKFEPGLVIDDTYLVNESVTDQPYAIYGEVRKHDTLSFARGWFYPVYQKESIAAKAAGNSSQVVSIIFNGMNTTLFMPLTEDAVFGGQLSEKYKVYPKGVPFIKGHDGSYVRAYLDYRDKLLIEFETRVYNNIKVEWSENVTDIHGFVGGDFRTSEFTRDEINRSLIREFTQWLTLVDNDYTSNQFYDRLNQFTFNYSNAATLNGNNAPGFWRGVYNRVFDTDRPHSHPWEMLGFFDTPTWWNDVYGPAPYTSDNLIMWRDLEDGIVREPGKEVVPNSKYARPGLTNALPVDDQGNLLSPLSSGAVKDFVLRRGSGSFEFGDHAPVETAWRKSSHYPFALITSMVLNKPAEVFNAGFDVNNNSTNLAGQKIYTNSGRQLSVRDLVFPSSASESNSVLTSGLVNYVFDLVASDILSVYTDYKKTLTSLDHKLGFKLGGFSDKEKLKLILESRSPAADQTANNFVPEENYHISLNVSSPVDSATYSGVLIEKTTRGFLIRGYNNSFPEFRYYSVLDSVSGITETVGGVSEPSTEWKADTVYQEGQVIENNQTYYRVTKSFTSGSALDTSNLAKLSKLPIVGGKSATFYKEFDRDEVKSLAYGSVLRTSQEVINFLLGYGEYLKGQGFEFNYVNNEGKVDNWKETARDFLFWTTQGWAEGTVISLSPAAERLEFKSKFSVVDDIYDEFYSFSTFQSDGTPIDTSLNSLYRSENSFGLETTDSNEGLYSIVLPLVQKEQVVVIDNRTVFNDIVYEPRTGYRKDRIKVSGYRTSDWSGGLNIPGFVFDNASVVDWEEWKDYRIGSLVKFKQYFYTAKENVPGSKTFDENKWERLNSRPEPQLRANFDYKINQFSDYYDVDTSAFNDDLQKMAHHLVGYQKRDYLSNIFNNDVSQFKFYQGMIQDKGTKNVLTKLFNKFDVENNETLEFFEDWAIKTGQFGAVGAVKQLEIALDQDKMRESPQPIALVDKKSPENFNNIYEVLPGEVFNAPLDYDHAPFVTKSPVETKLPTSGYVNSDDVDYVSSSKFELNSGDVNLLFLGDYIWVTGVGNEDWNVFQHIAANLYVREMSLNAETNSDGVELATLYTHNWVDGHVMEGDLVGVRAAQDYELNNIYLVESVGLESVTIQLPEDNNVKSFSDEELVMTKLRSVHVRNSADLNDLIKDGIYDNQRVWVDEFENGWAVVENTPVYNDTTVLSNSLDDSAVESFGSSIVSTQDNSNTFISVPTARNGVILYYNRPSDMYEPNLVQEIEIFDYNFDKEWKPNTEYKKYDRVYRKVGESVTYWLALSDLVAASTFDSGNWLEISNADNKLQPFETGFGQTIDVTPDGEYLAVGMPNASYIKTKNKGDFSRNKDYSKNDIVRYQESLWKANRKILKEVEDQAYESFSSYKDLADSSVEPLPALLLQGDPGLLSNTVDHLLVRAPAEMFRSTTSDVTELNFDLKLDWNSRSYVYPTLESFEPFDGEVSGITADFLSQEHRIQQSFDYVVHVDVANVRPIPGDQVVTNSSSGVVVYSSTRGSSVVLYIASSNGVFPNKGELFTETLSSIGNYELVAPSESDEVFGFWKIEVPEYKTTEAYSDDGLGLVYVDLKSEDRTRDFNFYYNIQESVEDIGEYFGRREQVSFVTQLSYTGDPVNADRETSTIRTISSNKWVVRSGNEFTNRVLGDFDETIRESNPSFEFRLFNDPDRNVGVADNGLTFDILNREQQVYDVWDGFIDLELTRFDSEGFAFQPQVGDIIEDVQIPNDGTGGLAQSTQSTSTAEVAYVQRNFNSLRLYVKNTQGSWKILNNILQVALRRLANTDLRGNDDVPRVFATVQDPENDIVIDNLSIGKLLVFEADTEFNDSRSWTDIPDIVDEEYYFYTRNLETGTSRQANLPSSNNKDFTQVYHISADQFGDPGGFEEGAVAIYRKLPNNTYRLDDIVVSEYGNEGRRFGKQVKISQDNSQYTLFVTSEGTQTRGDSGIIEIFYNGEKENYQGEYSDREYNTGDVVKYKDQFYKAKRDIPLGSSIQNSLIWDNISWRRAASPEYRGEWLPNSNYATGDVVWKDLDFYYARTNLSNQDTFNESTAWKLVKDDKVNHLSYLPNHSNIVAYNREVFDPETDIAYFGSEIDASGNGDVLVTVAMLTDSSSTVDTKALVYRRDQETYYLDQIIDSPFDVNTIRWGKNISISPNGEKLAISASTYSENRPDQGVVYVYSLNNGEFENIQVLTPPNNEESERFGSQVDIDNSMLAVSSINGDGIAPTTFDGLDTVFDNTFTRFRNTYVDSGVVYIFEQLNDRFVYSETIQTDIMEQDFPDVETSLSASMTDFGDTVIVNQNHVYIAVPTFLNNRGTRGLVFDYKKQRNASAWKKLRSSVNPVDLDTIDGVFVYNQRTNNLVSYVDFIDPLQGKIPGRVEEELTYKIGFDPASYNVGSKSDIAVNNDIFWGSEHVGQTWWNISNARFAYPYQGDIEFQKNEWNSLVAGTTVDVYEWVESELTPREWDNIANDQTESSNSISGQSLYGDEKFSARLVYDEISQTFTTLYYFWVKGKTTIPSNRSISVSEMEKLISRPREQGYKYVSLTADNRIILNNFENIVTSDDIVLAIRYKNSASPVYSSNTHNQYQLMSDGSSDSKLDETIEQKWFDSLIGFDKNYNRVPDIKVPKSNRIGILNNPRQTMFVNRIEALKQFIERVNFVFSKNLIVEQKGVSRLMLKDLEPAEASGSFDVKVDTVDDLNLVSRNKIEKAVLTPIFVNGRLDRVEIKKSGRGYKIPPNVEINGSGTGAEASTKLNNLGQVVDVVVTESGNNYDRNSFAVVRPFTVLVKADETINGRWALYGWNSDDKMWFRSGIQSFDVSKFWDYIDWYADGYNANSNVDFEIDGAYLLETLDTRIGSVVEIRNIDSGGWILLEKVSNRISDDLTTNYDVVGREQGTIQFDETLFTTVQNNTGFDNQSFDSRQYDRYPAVEMRIIFEALRDDILTSDLAVEYNQLFFSSLRYILSEQDRVDWMFKTSYINVIHNLGDLSQPVNYVQDKSQSFEDFVREVKPYKTKIRNFTGTHNTIDNTKSQVSDFDSPARYSAETGTFVTESSTVCDGKLIKNSNDNDTVVSQTWKETLGYSVTDIHVVNGGSGYRIPPNVVIKSNSSSGATAKAYVGYGKVTHIEVVTPGQGYFDVPGVEIAPPQGTDIVQATASAVVGSGLVRTPSVSIKFDRIAGKYTVDRLVEKENFVGTNIDTDFKLTWPMDLDSSNVDVYVNGQEKLRSEYTFTNEEEKVDDNFGNRSRFVGVITFTTPPELDAKIEVNYLKSLEFFSAEDRVKFGYRPTSNMLGNELSQLMEGIDYGGVEVKSFAFGSEDGWDTVGWFTDSWDKSATFEDFIFTFTSDTTALSLNSALEDGVVYNVYKNGVRIDDPKYPSDSVDNENAIMSSITGDGTTETISVSSLNTTLDDGDIIIIRKTTSDGSLEIDPASYDTRLQGGNLGYSTAKGITPEEIVVDGDGFMTPENSGGPEELVPGKVLDTLDIQVYTRKRDGQGFISSQVLKHTETEYKVDATPSSNDALIIKVDGNIIDSNLYLFDWERSTVVIDESVTGNDINIVVQELGVNGLVDFGRFVATSRKTKISTDVIWSDQQSIFASVNGVTVSASKVKEGSQKSGYKTVIRLDNSLKSGDVLNWAIFENSDEINYSQVSKETVVVDDGADSIDLGSTPIYEAPLAQNILVAVNNKFIRSGYNIKYVATNPFDREFRIEQFQYPPGSVEADDLEVYRNGEQLFTPDDWRLSLVEGTVVLDSSLVSTGDIINISVIKDADFKVDGSNVSFNEPLNGGDVVDVYYFNNHDIVDIEKINYDLVSRKEITAQDVDYVTYNRMTVGEIKLRATATLAQYVWVIVNGNLLTPSVDYYLTEGHDRVRIVKPLEQNDEIEIVHFSAPVSSSGFAFRQFKDILNRTHYKMSGHSQTTLAQPLAYDDLRIEVTDGNMLSEGGKSENKPGVIWIAGERIEYFVKEENTLRQLRRGTLGTAISDVYEAGEAVFDQSARYTVPYQDDSFVQNFVSDGETTEYELNFQVNNANEVEVFVAGSRLRKNSLSVFDSSVAQDSPSGDIIKEPEFHIQDGMLLLTEQPVENTRVTVIKRVGKMWNDNGVTLANTSNSISTFLQSGGSK